MRTPLSHIRPVLCAALLWAGAAATALAQVAPQQLEGMKARGIGPAAMSGRIASVEASERDPNLMYVGAATGGLWKSTNGGLTWRPVFDDQPVASIGAVALFQPNPDIVWVGTGEGNPRNSMGVGGGLWKSMDGGATWSFLGLGKSERIHRILLHPTDPDVAYIGVLGPAWSDGEERGVYRTTDGGKTFQRVLYVNARTGVGDLVMDPANPNKLIAAMWEYRRWPWSFRSGGPGSGLFVTHDGGATWTRLGEKEGLPAGELGRIGLAIARNNPAVVYALVEARESALLRSDDGGRSFRTVNTSRGVASRPFYYNDIYVDPTNENRIYSLQAPLMRSEDGGKSFERVDTRIHVDHHAFWQHPGGRMIVMGNDGGVGISRDGGRSWQFVVNLPLAQYYHVNVDMELPFNVYGGLQDNGSWRGPSAVWERGGIKSHRWMEVGGGDGFGTLVDPSDPAYGYSMSQGGNLRRFNWVTGERKDIKPVHPEGVELRFNWNAAIAHDPFDPKTIYYGSQFLHRSTDRGDSWQILSPDLTTNDPEKQRQRESGGLTIDATGAENHTTIFTIAPSPVERGVIWVGTDDGNIQVTRDGGRSWTNVVRNIRGGPPAGSWVSHLEASRFDAGTAFAVIHNYQRGDFGTYVYRTTDFGRSWTSLATPELQGFARVLEQDPVQKDLLYLGTEAGLFVSLNGGKSWLKWTHGVPTVPVHALVVHPRDHDLVVGTHGRALYILDDVRPLRELVAAPAIASRRAHLFEVPPAYLYRQRPADGIREPGYADFEGENRPYGALLTYFVGSGPTTLVAMKAAGDSAAQRPERAEIEVLDATGAVIRRFEDPARPGVNRTTWDLRRQPFRRPAAAGQGGFGGGGGFGGAGPDVLPGTYTLRVRFGGEEASRTVEVRADPRFPVPLPDRQEKYDALLRAGARQEAAAAAMDRLRETVQAVDGVLALVQDRQDPASREVRAAGDSLKKQLAVAGDSLGVFGRITSVIGSMSSSWDRPTQMQQVRLAQAERDLERAVALLNRVLSQDAAAFGRRVQAAGLPLFPEVRPVSVDLRAGSPGAPSGDGTGERREQRGRHP